MKPEQQPSVITEVQRLLGLADFSLLFHVLNRDLGTDSDSAENYPVWALNCASKVTRARFPTAYELSVEKSRRAYSLGAALGMMHAGQVLMASKLGSLVPEAPQPTDEQFAAAVSSLYGEDAQEYTFSCGDLIPDQFREKSAELEAGFGLTELAEYHQGFADAVRMLAGENKATEATAIYTFMVMYWRHVDRMPSVDALFEILTQHLGANVVGPDPKRVAQICRRVGKSFRPPGRPRKTTSRRR